MDMMDWIALGGLAGILALLASIRLDAAQLRRSMVRLERGLKRRFHSGR